MQRRRGPRTAGVAAFLACLGLISLAIVPALGADGSVSIAGFAFAPSSVTVGVGDSVTWTNNDGVAHTATGSAGSFDTESLGAGESATISFATAGTFAYVCAIHPTMNGTVVVEAAGATLAPTAAPTADSGSSGGGGTTITPAPTDTVPAPAPVSGDAIGAITILLAVLGVSMLVGTLAVGRRGPRGGR